MERICEQIQEKIAVETELGSEAHEHIKSCGNCEYLFEEYQSMKFLVLDSGPEVPAGFADVVMRRITQEEQVKQEDWTQKPVSFFEKGLAISQVRYFALGIGGAVSVMNLIRFVFFVLIPA